MAKYGEVLRTVVQPGPRLILVHDHVETPMETVLHAPVGAGNLAEPFRGDSRLFR
jgi:hypothetical protein